MTIIHDKSRFVLCVDNRDYSASLEVKKIYRVCPDRSAEKEGMIRVIDESGEDYLYPRACFAAVSLSHDARVALESVA